MTLDFPVWTLREQSTKLLQSFRLPVLAFSKGSSWGHLYGWEGRPLLLILAWLLNPETSHWPTVKWIYKKTANTWGQFHLHLIWNQMSYLFTQFAGLFWNDFAHPRWVVGPCTAVRFPILSSYCACAAMAWMSRWYMLNRRRKFWRKCAEACRVKGG